MKATALPFGISFTFWFIVGLIRLLSEKVRFRKKRRRNLYKLSDIAVILPAHNEEKVIRSSIQFLKRSLDKKQIYVVSDGSNDKTYRRARMEGCHVSKLEPGKGKAKAMVYLLNRFRVFERYKLIFIVDADTKIDPVFPRIALQYLSDKEIAVVTGGARIVWPQHIIPRWKYYIIAYRERLNRSLQYFLNYGMTWKHTNVTFVIPGFATIYKSEVLRQLEIDTPDLQIEDFNLAFQLHRRKLGKIAYHPSMIAWDQHPDNMHDYWNQVKRWNIGFFQTIKKNGVWLSFFWLALLFFSIEVFLSSIFTLVVLPLLLAVTLYGYWSSLVTPATTAYQSRAYDIGPYHNLTLGKVVIYILLIDYIFTVGIGLINKKPQFIIYGPFFFFMHFITSLILLSSIIPGFIGRSDGRWISPKRREEKII